MRLRTEQPAKKQTRQLLLVDDHPILREGFARLIEQEPDLKVSGHADTPAKAVGAIARGGRDRMPQFVRGVEDRAPVLEVNASGVSVRENGGALAVSQEGSQDSSQDRSVSST